MAKNNIIYLVETVGCHSCQIQQVIIHDIVKDLKDITFIVCGYMDLSANIRSELTPGDFPLTIFCENDKPLYWFSGTKTKKKMISTINNVFYANSDFKIDF